MARACAVVGLIWQRVAIDIIAGETPEVYTPDCQSFLVKLGGEKSAAWEFSFGRWCESIEMAFCR